MRWDSRPPASTQFREFRRTSLWLALAGGLVMSAACSDGPTSVAPVRPYYILSDDKASVGQSITMLVARQRDNCGFFEMFCDEYATATWSSSDNTIATVKSQTVTSLLNTEEPGAVVTGLRQGRVIITATIGGSKATRNVIVY